MHGVRSQTSMVFLSGTAGGESTPRHYDTRMEERLRTMDGSEWLSSHFGNFTPAERAPRHPLGKGLLDILHSFF
jgi:hypothetical protein